MNKVKLQGFLAKAPEIKTSKNNQEFATLLVMVDDSYTNKENQHVERAFYINCVVFGKLVPLVKTFDIKNEVEIEGKVTSNEWKDKHFNNIGVASIKLVKRTETPTIEYPENNINVEDVPF